LRLFESLAENTSPLLLSKSLTEDSPLVSLREKLRIPLVALLLR
jgi:hypothetical protein